jgi:hypothetical protein
MARKDIVTTPPGKKAGGKIAKGSPLHPLHEAALKLAGLGPKRPPSKTRDLVAMLLGHGARAWRANQPKAQLHLHVSTPKGRHPIRMRLR